MYSTLLYSTLLCSTLLYASMLYYTVLYYTLLCYTVACYSVIQEARTRRHLKFSRQGFRLRVMGLGLGQLKGFGLI